MAMKQIKPDIVIECVDADHPLIKDNPLNKGMRYNFDRKQSNISASMWYVAEYDQFARFIESNFSNSINPPWRFIDSRAHHG